MTRALALVPVALLAVGCGHLDEVDVQRSASVTVPGAPGGAALPATAFGTIDVRIGRDTLDAEGIDPDDVDSARLRAVRLEVTAGTNLPAWLDSVELFIEGPGLARTLLARRTGIDALPAGTTAVDLETQNVDLKPFVLAPTTSISAEVIGSAPPVDTTIRITATVRVDVSVSGLLR